MNIVEAANLWKAGNSTKQIANALQVREADVYNRLELIKFTDEMLNWKDAA